MEHEEAIELCDSILSKCETLSDIEAAQDFAGSVSEKVNSMKEWISNNQKVTDKMSVSLSNMDSGCDKWLSRSND